MMHRDKQITAILFSLLLVFLPMQSSIAAVLFSDQPAEHSMMEMDHESSISCCEGHADCSTNNTCEANDCSSGHCATCVVAGILGNSKVPPITSNKKIYFASNYLILSKSLNNLYRPPRA